MSSLISSAALGSLLSGQDNLIRIATLLLGYFFGPYSGFLPTDANIMALGTAALFMPTALRGGARVLRGIRQNLSNNAIAGLGTAVAAACALFLLYSRTSLLPTVLSQGIEQLLKSSSAAGSNTLEMAQAGLKYSFGVLGITGGMEWISSSMMEFLNSYGFDQVFNPVLTEHGPLTMLQSQDELRGATSSLFSWLGSMGTTFGPLTAAQTVAEGSVAFGPQTASVAAAAAALAASPHFIFVAIARLMQRGGSQGIANAFATYKQQMFEALKTLLQSAPGSAAALRAYNTIVAATDTSAIMGDGSIPLVVKMFAAIKVWMVAASEFVLSKVQTLFPAATVPQVVAGFAFVIGAIGVSLYLRRAYGKGGRTLSPDCLHDFARVAEATSLMSQQLIDTVGKPGFSSHGHSLAALSAASRRVAATTARSDGPSCIEGLNLVLGRFARLGEEAPLLSSGQLTERAYLVQARAAIQSSAADLRSMADRLQKGSDEASVTSVTAIMESVDFVMLEAGMLMQKALSGETVAVTRRPLFDRTAAILAHGTVESGGMVGNRPHKAIGAAARRSARGAGGKAASPRLKSKVGKTPQQVQVAKIRARSRKTLANAAKRKSKK